MSIASTENNANTTTTYSDYALAIHQAGFNVLPIKPHSKTPDLPSWGDFSTRQQTKQEVRGFSWGPNLAIINGINNIRTIDIDGCGDNADILFGVLQLLGLDFDYQWVVQSPGKGGGFHIYIICPDALTLTSNAVLVGDPLPGQDFKQIELRWSKCYTMFPPSIHPDTNTAYQWLFSAPTTPMAIVPITVVESAFRSIAIPQKKAKEQTPKQEQKKIIHFDAWAQRALDQEISTVRSAREGGRNTQLNRSAYALGQIIGIGLLDRNKIMGELLRTACATGLDEQEANATIASGLDAGIKKPRMPRLVFKENEPPLKLKPLVNADDEKIASFSADDQGHAECVHFLYGNFIAHNDAEGWLVWDGTHYVPSIARINSLIVDVLRRRQRAAAHCERTDLAKVSRAMAGTVAATRSMLETLAHTDVGEFDNEPDLINTLNGIVNLRTKTLIAHDPAYHFTWVSPVRYNPDRLRDTSSNLWLDFVRETVESDEMITYLQEALGYSITGHISEECLFYIFGPPRSGKGTLSETILSIFPRPIAIEVDFNTFTAKREGDNQNFDLAPLKPARIVFASESNKYQSLNPAKVKALTGGNMVNCAHKYGKFFSYQPTYTVWLSSNHEVNGDADDDALWGRVKVVHFPHSRLGNEDKSLKRRMQSPENLEAVLAWIIEGAYQWYQRESRGLDTPKSVTDLTQAQRASQDSVGLWLEECCEMVEGEWVSNTAIRISYDNWCEANGYEPKKAKGLTQSLAAHHLETGARKRTYTSPSDTGTQTRGVIGLRII